MGATTASGRSSGEHAQAPTAFHDRVRRRPLLVGVPLYRRPDLARRLIASLIACAADLAALDAEVVLYDDSPDDDGLTAALDEMLPKARAAFSCRLKRNRENLGFVRTADQALREAASRGFDALLLNSDTVVTPGALPEMSRVALSDPMIGFVNPRSNNATLATLPYQDGFRHLAPEAAQAAWARLAPALPPVSYTPTANGFCMWVRWPVLAEFGGFDFVYAEGYNEENDLVMRAGRRGYRAALANHAFVWHEGSQSFGTERHQWLEQRNRAVLLARYPEYAGLTGAYFSSPEQRAELLMGSLIPDAQGRLDVALDFSSFVAAHNGTFEAGVQLLKAALTEWAGRFNLFVLCAADTYLFHGLDRLGVARREPYGPETYAMIFRVGQPYDRGVLERLALKGATFGVYMLDTISLDCSALYDPAVHALWAYTTEHSDLVTGLSRLTSEQLDRRFVFGPHVVRGSSLLSLDLDDYRPTPHAATDAPARPGFIFVVGNHYWHKEVAAAANALAAAYPERQVVVLGSDRETSAPADDGEHAPRGLGSAPNLLRLGAGALTPQTVAALYSGAAAVVVPSHYEGFGLPVLNALAAKRPVFVRPLPVFEELYEGLGGEANLHLFTTTEELVRMLAEPPPWNAAGASPGRPGDARRLAREIGEAMDAAIASADYARIVRRIRALPQPPPVPEPEPATSVAFLARRAGRMAENAAAVVLDVPGVLPLLRAMKRAVRRLTARAARGR